MLTNTRLPFEDLFAVAGFYNSGAHDCSMRWQALAIQKSLFAANKTSVFLTALTSTAQNSAGSVPHLRNFATVGSEPS
jgi:hypothetical protein